MKRYRLSTEGQMLDDTTIGFKVSTGPVFNKEFEVNAKLAALERRVAQLTEWALYAEEIINDGVAIMTLEEMSSWGGVRHCLETNPADKET